MYVCLFLLLSIRKILGFIQDRISEARPIFVCHNKVSFFEIAE